MSKAKLRKELQTMTHPQLVDVVMAAYDSSPKAKQYFEFFLNPDVTKLYDAALATVEKEIRRSSRGYCKARISFIRAEIRGFAAFGVPADDVARLMISTLRMLLANYQNYYYTDALTKGTLRLAADYMRYCAENDMLSTGAAKMRETLDTTAPKYFRRAIEERLAEENFPQNLFQNL